MPSRRCGGLRPARRIWSLRPRRISPVPRAGLPPKLPGQAVAAVSALTGTFLDFASLRTGGSNAALASQRVKHRHLCSPTATDPCSGRHALARAGRWPSGARGQGQTLDVRRIHAAHEPFDPDPQQLVRRLGRGLQQPGLRRKKAPNAGLSAQEGRLPRPRRRVLAEGSLRGLAIGLALERSRPAPPRAGPGSSATARPPRTLGQRPQANGSDHRPASSGASPSGGRSDDAFRSSAPAT